MQGTFRAQHRPQNVQHAALGTRAHATTVGRHWQCPSKWVHWAVGVMGAVQTSTQRANFHCHARNTCDGGRIHWGHGAVTNASATFITSAALRVFMSGDRPPRRFLPPALGLGSHAFSFGTGVRACLHSVGAPWVPDANVSFFPQPTKPMLKIPNPMAKDRARSAAHCSSQCCALWNFAFRCFFFSTCQRYSHRHGGCQAGQPPALCPPPPPFLFFRHSVCLEV